MSNTIHPAARIGAVALAVSDFDQVARFYTNHLGLKEMSNAATPWHTFGAGEHSLVRLITATGAPLNPRIPGLFHMAILMPGRFELARTLYQLAESNYHLQGASDHGVSEALYLADPLGNGIEIYSDRPQSEWPRDEQGNIDMVTQALNLDRLLFELKGKVEPWKGIDPRTRIGHVHLQVNDIPAAEHFYTQVIGLELQQRYGSQASFLSAGGYHHHVGINTWNSRGSTPAPDDAAGLRYFELLLPDAAALGEVTARIEAAELPMSQQYGGVLVKDPSGNGVLLLVEG
ncbi:MAG TPA: glyoxalase [Anaerolineaceae bacterium]|nr:glyoxalase [Anaerolineaceae bacterium]